MSLREEMSMDKYIRIAGHLFKRTLVVNFTMRNSFLWLFDPFVVEITYAKPWVETHYVNVGSSHVSGSIPTGNDFHETMKFKYSYGREYLPDLVRLEELVRESCPNAVVVNTIKQMTSKA